MCSINAVKCYPLRFSGQAYALSPQKGFCSFRSPLLVFRRAIFCGLLAMGCSLALIAGPAENPANLAEPPANQAQLTQEAENRARAKEVREIEEQTFKLWGLWLSGAAGLVTVGGFCFGLWQYSRAEKWKRTEFLACEMRAFFAD